MLTVLGHLLLSAALVLGAAAIASPRSVVDHPFALLVVIFILTIVLYFRSYAVWCLRFVLPAGQGVKLTVAPVLCISAIGILFCIIVLAHLISQGTSTYVGEFKQYCCTVPLLSSLLWHCHSTEVSPRTAPSTIAAATIADHVSLCSSYERVPFGASQPNLALSLPLSSNIVSNMSLLRSAHSLAPLADLVGNLNEVVLGMRQLADFAGGIIALADRTYERWQIRIEAHAGRKTPWVLYCNSFAWLFDPFYTCREDTLPSKVHESLKQSFDALSSKSNAVVELAAKQHAALFSVHNLLSEVWLVAAEDRKDELVMLRRTWAPGARGDHFQLLDIAQSVQGHSTGLRCAIQVATGAINRLIGSFEALAAATAAPPAELNQVWILLGALADGNVAVLEATRQLGEVLGGS